MSGTKTFPFQTLGLTSLNSRKSSVPTRLRAPPRAESALALSFAHTTVPQRLLPHGWMRTWTLFDVLRRTMSCADFCDNASAAVTKTTAATARLASLSTITVARRLDVLALILEQ